MHPCRLEAPKQIVSEPQYLTHPRLREYDLQTKKEERSEILSRVNSREEIGFRLQCFQTEAIYLILEQNVHR